MAKVCVLVLVCFLLQSASLQLPKVEVREVSDQGEGVRAHDIHVECPNDCVEKVFFELDCSTGALVTGRPANDYIDSLEQKLDALEQMLAVAGLGGEELAREDVNSRVVNLEEKVDRVVQCLLGY